MTAEGDIQTPAPFDPRYCTCGAKMRKMGTGVLCCSSLTPAGFTDIPLEDRARHTNAGVNDPNSRWSISHAGWVCLVGWGKLRARWPEPDKRPGPPPALVEETRQARSALRPTWWELRGYPT